MNLDDPRPRIITPRVRGYVHRPVIAVRGTLPVTEDGEVIEDPAQYAADNDGHIWIVDDPAWLLNTMMAAHGEHPDFNYQIVTSEDDAPVRAVKSRVTRFGFRCRHDKDTPEREACPYRRRRAMHTVWSPSDLSPTPGKILTDYTHASLLELACDIREWCMNEDIPLPSTLAGIANSLLRDKRFWPDARGRVPRATNENVRRFLPGVYSELLASPGKPYHGVALDQKTAYHVAAQEIPTPDPTTLFARGYFNEPATAPVWARPGTVLYNRTMSQPGIVYVVVEVRHLRKHQHRPPAVREAGKYRVGLWTNEIPLCEGNGVTIHGIIAAWTANTPDPGLPNYGAYAQRAITEASPYRQRWLKPTLHAVYGLLATRPRRVKIGHLRGRSPRGHARIGFGHEFDVAQADLGIIQPLTVNVAMLGVLQAEIRKRSFELATELSRADVDILHIHADGLHVTGELPFIPQGWSIEPLTNLHYLDTQSWLCKEGNKLPGRDARARVEAIESGVARMKVMGEQSQRTPDTGWAGRPDSREGEDVTPEDMEPLHWPDGTKRYYVTYATGDTDEHSHRTRDYLSNLMRRVRRSRSKDYTPDVTQPSSQGAQAQAARPHRDTR